MEPAINVDLVTIDEVDATSVGETDNRTLSINYV